MDPLAPFARQEPCWCGSGRTYRLCHKKYATPRSSPNAPLPADDELRIYVSPSTAIAKSALDTLMPKGTPLVLPSGTESSRPVPFSSVDSAIASRVQDDEPLTPAELGGLRLHLLHELSRLPEIDSPISDSVVEGITQSALLAWKAATSRALEEPKPTILWNEAMSSGRFIARTILLADHVLTPDTLYEAALRGASHRRVRELAVGELENAALVRSGHLVAVPAGAALSIGGQAIRSMTDLDLRNRALVEFVRGELVVEGPTAREALFINARDDHETQPFMWFYGHLNPDSVSDDGQFRMRTFGSFIEDHDYEPWLQQTRMEAVSRLVQRTDARLVTADLLGAEYVATSPFEARLLRRRAADERATASASALWADVPALRDLTSKDLARLLAEDEALEALRAEVRKASKTGTSLSEQAEAIQDAVADIERASASLERRMRTDRAYSAIAPTLLGGAGLLVSAAGDIQSFLPSALGVLSGVVPFLGSRKNNRREAPYLFVMARRREKRRR